jgi:hypothetical protein
MANYTIDSVIRTENDNYYGYRMVLKNSKGMVIEVPDDKDKDGGMIDGKLNLSIDYIIAALENQEVDTDLIPRFSFIDILLSATIDATIDIKTKGEDFIASEFTDTVTVGGKRVKAKAGQVYKVEESGLRLDYQKDVRFNFDRKLLKEILNEAKMENYKMELMKAQMEKEMV